LQPHFGFFSLIDLHSHILPGLDDGAKDIAVSLGMARIAVADGISCMACTPHIFTGKYENTSAIIIPAMEHLQAVLDDEGIQLKLILGADVHIAVDLVDRIKNGEIPTLNDTRYFLLEPPHEVLPPRLEDLATKILNAGFIPIITHPERLTWVRRHYDVLMRLVEIGCPLQLTAGSILGDFGEAAKKLSEKILKDGLATIFASDAHGISRRQPLLSKAYEVVSVQVGDVEANRLFYDHPSAILADLSLGVTTKSRSNPGNSGSHYTSVQKIFNRMFRDR